MSGIGPGDVVVCVDDSPCRCCGGALVPKKGSIFRVESVCAQYSRLLGEEFTILVLVGVPAAPRHARGVNASRFRKIDKSDESFALWMRALRPARRSVDA